MKGVFIMMMNQTDIKISKVLRILNLSGFETDIAERYLLGEAGEEELKKLQARDLSGYSWDENHGIYDVFEYLCEKNQKSTAVRLFNLLFVIGKDTCVKMIPWKMTEEEDGILFYRVVVYLCMKLSDNSMHMYYNLRNVFPSLLKMVQNNPQTLKELAASADGYDIRYKIVLLALYFAVKYPKVSRVAEEDRELMKEYETLLAEYLKQGLPAGSFSVIFFTGKMAYMNFQLSPVLKDVLTACLESNTAWTLISFMGTRLGENNRTDIDGHGADYDEELHIDPKAYIRWAALAEYKTILKRQLEKNTDDYLTALDEESMAVFRNQAQNFWFRKTIDAVNVLKDILKEENPKLYQKEVAENTDHSRAIAAVVPDAPHAGIAKDYLQGNCDISKLYPYAEEFEVRDVMDYLDSYRKHCTDEAFFNRCKAFMVLTDSSYTRVVDDGEESAEKAEAFFQGLAEEKMDLGHLLLGFAGLYKQSWSNYYRRCSDEVLLEGAVNIFTRYLNEQREETLAAFQAAKAEGRFLALRVLRAEADKNKKEILSYVSDSSKIVKEEFFEIVSGKKEWEGDVKEFLAAKKAAVREMAVRILEHWQKAGGDYKDVLTKAMEQEKNKKVLTQIHHALNVKESDLPQEELSKADLIKQLHKGNKKRTLAWAYETPFSIVHKTNGETAEEEYLQAVLLCYSGPDGCGISKNAAFLAEDLNTAEFAVYVNELFDKWLAANAESKKRWVLYAASIHGGNEIITKIQRQVQEWPLIMRGAIAAEAVRALALNPLPRALLLVDGMSRKFKFKQVKKAAGEALEFAASQLGISREELSDRIVPDLGFDENMKRMFDYGTRSFTVTVTPALEIEVYDETGKKLKNMPSPGKRDDEKKAAAAYEEYKLMKKQMKATVSSQKMRLEFALSVKRIWKTDAWKKLFVKNPLMHQFAIGLIWGVYEDGKLTQCFRYMEDGSFNTKDEEEYELPEESQIGLVHPVELSKEETEAWKEQLSDYEITQPFMQLDRPVYRMTEEEAGTQSLERFGGCIINGLSLNGKLTAAGWYKGSVEDGGCYYTYYREDAESGMGVELHFSGCPIGDYSEDVTIYDARFYKAGEVAHGSYCYDEADKNKAYFLKDVPQRYFSEIVLQLAKAAASSQERDENWKKSAEIF